MHATPFTRSLLASGIASLLWLTACGGGGGGIVRTSSPPVGPTTALPPTMLGPCQSSSADCILLPTADSSYHVLGGGRTTSGKLLIDGAYARFETGTYRFAAGSEILGGDVMVLAGANLVSNIVIRHGGLRVFGSATGNIENLSLFMLDGGQLHGDLRNSDRGFLFNGTIRGDVSNQGRFFANQNCYPYADECAPLASSRIDGDFTQTATGALWLTLGMPLQVTGAAGLDGTLHVVAQRFRLDAPYVLPGAGTSQHLLHAAGGISGTFDQWQSSGSGETGDGIFLEGGLRYTGTDLYFDVTRASLQAAISGAGIGSSITLASAAGLDRAFLQADTFAVSPASTLNVAQQRFLQSAAAIQHIDNMEQAVVSLDSLSGVQQTEALQHLARRQVRPSQAASLRLDRMRPGLRVGAWSHSAADSIASGFDRWINPRLLMGTQVAIGDAMPKAAAYLRWFGERGWYAGGEAGVSRHQVALGRTLDLGPGGRWNAHSQRTVDVANFRAEAGRNLAFAGGTFTPFATLDTVGMRGERVMEQGYSGFELALQPQRNAYLFGSAGLRFARDWRLGERGWLRLDASAGYLRQLARVGDPSRAAFVGMPYTWFDLPESTNRGGSWQGFGLRAGRDNGWSVSLDYQGQRQATQARPDWWLGMHRQF